MKLSCRQEDLRQGLEIVSRAVATRATLPITQNVLIATEESRLRLSATNLEIALSCWLNAEIEEEGAITIPARLLTQFVDSLPNERVEFSLLPGKTGLHLRCARFEARINGLDAADFPPIPKLTEGMAIEVDPEALRLAINQVVFAAATEDTRPVLTGVHCEFEGDTLTLAAADGFRLAVHRLSLSSPVESKVAVIIPARALSELSRLLTDQEEPVKLMVNPERGQCLFSLTDVEMVSQLIQGTFPNYSQLIPSSYTTRVVVNRSEFLKATRTVAIFARDGGGIVRLVITPGEELTPGKVTLSARSEEVGENVGEVDAVVTGEPIKIAFNSKYLLDVLNVIKEEQIALDTTSSTSPGVIRPVGTENYIHVVMPMFVQWP